MVRRKYRLDITLNVPITMDNEYQNAVGTVNWQFKAEVPDDNDGGKIDNGNGGSNDDGNNDGGNGNGDKNTDDPDNDKDGGKSTKTGDKVMIGLFVALLVAAAAGLVVVAIRRRRE